MKLILALGCDARAICWPVAFSGQRDRGTEGQRDRGTEGQRDRGTEGQRDRGTEGQTGRRTDTSNRGLL